MTTPPEPRYNLFVAVLADLLAGPPLDTPTAPPRGHTLDDLDDMGVVDDFHDPQIDDRIHPETVRRFKKSLRVAGTFPVLSKQDMRKVTRTFHLSAREQRRLRAAILATSIEAKLVPRIGIDRALKAAWGLLPVIEEGLERLEDDEASGVPYIRGNRGATAMNDETELDRRYSSALEAIDRAMLALALVDNVTEQIEREDCARQARDGFTAALAKLAAADATMRADPAWQLWQHEAAEGLRAANRYLDSSTLP